MATPRTIQMKALAKSRLALRLRQVAGISMAWAFIGALDAYFIHAASNNDYLQRTEAYDFFRFFWGNTVASFLGGILAGSLLVFYMRERFRDYPFGLALLLNSIIISIFSFAFTALAFDVFLSQHLHLSFNDPLILEKTASLMRGPYYLKTVVLWSIVTFMTVVSLQVHEKYGPGVLRKMLLGRYHQPREEERIFMFVDIKSSTTIAERLGHVRFFNLLNDFFRDITNPILYTSGEVYQYVGDEVILSWNMEKGLQKANCIRCFFSMQEAINRKAHRYRERYGVVPEFKAGLHCGSVTTGEIGVIKKDIVFSGDVMNTTSRIQSMCNDYGVKILFSKYLMDKLNLPPHGYQPRRMGIIELRGKRQKVELFTLNHSSISSAPPPTITTL
ncbi:MAG: adenylate/guanylate cyclase domain-containing protein [Phaeodactylibacter sp.]|nr:adenylate/guanylate cyclase domain-containing protein [Phaeodactylibacter sp.]